MFILKAISSEKQREIERQRDKSKKENFLRRRQMFILQAISAEKQREIERQRDKSYKEENNYSFCGNIFRETKKRERRN